MQMMKMPSSAVEQPSFLTVIECTITRAVNEMQMPSEDLAFPSPLSFFFLSLLLADEIKAFLVDCQMVSIYYLVCAQSRLNP